MAVYAQLLSCVQFFETLWTVALQATLSMGFFQARILKWVAISSFRGSSPFRYQTCILWVFCIAGRLFTTEPSRKPLCGNIDYSNCNQANLIHGLSTQ